MKKFTYLALAAVLCAGLFAGCRSRSNQPMRETTMPVPSTMATTQPATEMTTQPATEMTTHPSTEAPAESSENTEGGMLDTTPGNDTIGGNHTEGNNGNEGHTRRIPGNH